MKKHLIAAAVAGALAAPAMAQVTVGGILDVNAHGSLKTTTTTAAGVETFTKVTGTSQAAGWNTSVINISATEDLGGGLRATAFMNMIPRDVATDTQTSFGQRDRYLNLAGGFGALRIGRFAPTIDSHGGYSGHLTAGAAGALDHVSSGGANVFGVASTTGNDFGRQSNIIQLTLPTMSGFTAAVGYADNKSSTQATTATTSSKMQYLSAEYKAGPLSVMVATGDRKRAVARTAGTAGYLSNATTTATPFGNSNATVVSVAAGFTAGTGVANYLGAATGTFARVTGSDPVAEASHKTDFDWLGARYNFGIAEVSASHARRKDRTTTGAATNNTTDTFATFTEVTNGDIDISSIGLVVPAGALTFRAMAYRGDDNRGTGAADDKKLSGYQVGAQYALSKRTFAYVAAGENESANKSGTASTGNTVKRVGTIMGLSHSF